MGGLLVEVGESEAGFNAGHHDRLGELLNEAGEDGDVDAWYDAGLIDPDYPELELKLIEQGRKIRSHHLQTVSAISLHFSRLASRLHGPAPAAEK